MAIHVAIDHSTRYQYDRPVRLSPHLIRLTPAPHTRTPLHDYRLDVEPANHKLYWQQDPFGNIIARAVFPEPVKELHVRVRLVADMTVINPFDFFLEDYAEHYPFEYDAALRHELSPYFEITERGPHLMKWLSEERRDKQHIVDFLVGVNARLQKRIGYTVRMEPGIQTCEETFERSLGSCRDTGFVLVQILRHMGIAARFVSGYLVQLTADEKSLDGPSGPEQDFTDLHAWAEAYVPGAGWIGLDPTSGLFAGEGHIPLTCTPDPVSAAPLTGFTDKCEVSFVHENAVTRVHEDPRVTKPYSEAQWAAIQALGRSVDSELNALDVRLTMGGEPTFVSNDDMEGAEWNTEALGTHKRERAGVLLSKLKAAFAPGGFLHYGQGKWYPGEPIPRWALGCFWRSDGQPIWRDARWLADEARNYGFGAPEAQRLLNTLARRLGIDPELVRTGREDWAYYLWREARTPMNAKVASSHSDAQFRDDLALALGRGLGQPVGFALPLQWEWTSGRWRSGTWQFSRGEMFLIPGSSPMGLRLPLDQLAWVQQVEREWPPQGPRAPAPPLEPGRAPSFERMPPRAADAEAPPNTQTRVWEGVPHAALCVEPRDGKLYVFMPLLNDFEHYASLLAAIEVACAKEQLPVLIEGYEPPKHGALQSLKVTPDPGVIEVNIHPAASWDALEHNTVALYEAARQSRLGAEKFMIDGRHSGTGGGNHVTMGSARPTDSPFLRRPDLLRSLVTYWQHHPALSYLFSGMFIGPTSQAPRVDEKGSSWLRELECSFNEIEQGASAKIVDRALRNFMTDLTGNTHRAEFCIDKLCSPDSSAGQQGLLEFRGFEMPPHARMSLAQMSLLRALVARFWKAPYRHPLVRWGTALHDRFLLPEPIWADFCDVIADLQLAGYAFDATWFLPFQEFRFPVYGRAQYDDVQIELRMGLEPWPVLGEEATAQRQARVVDSALERVQVKVSGLDAERYLLTCNGRRLPLQPSAKLGEYVAGVRYKAWQAAFGLHPTIAAHAPVVVDVFDRRIGRSIGGCVYHVSHPGGRGYDTFPVNANEAEARRISRFWAYGHSVGEPNAPAWCETLRAFYAPAVQRALSEPCVEPQNPEFPYTLDLRRSNAPRPAAASFNALDNL
ncbi:MAG TPA: transglutaminase family protein [Polyangiales bacterium]|nr:transglutaminase family protein [Polyangiales bacterium]